VALANFRSRLTRYEFSADVHAIFVLYVASITMLCSVLCYCACHFCCYARYSVARLTSQHCSFVLRLYWEKWCFVFYVSCVNVRGHNHKQASCPMCQQSIKPVTAAFTQCKFYFFGAYNDEKTSGTCSSHGILVSVYSGYSVYSVYLALPRSIGTLLCHDRVVPCVATIERMCFWPHTVFCKILCTIPLPKK